MISSPTRTEPASAPGVARRSGLTLRRLLGLGYGAMALAALVALAGYIVIDRAFVGALARYSQTAAPLADLASTSMERFLRARRFEKDFLLAARTLGTVESKARYGALFQSAIEDARGSLAQIAAAEGQDQQERKNRIAAIQAKLAHYEAGFLRLVQMKSEMGFEASGLEGEFRQAAHRLERGIGQDDYANHAGLLALRRAEKDYILRGRPHDATRFSEAAANLRMHLKTASRPAAAAPGLRVALDDYEKLFARYVALGGNADEVMREYLALAQEIEPAIDTLRLDLSEAASAEFAALDTLVIQAIAVASTLSMLVLVFAIGIALHTSRTITRSTGQISAFASALARGETGARLNATGGDEFSQIARALDAMAESLETANREQQASENAILQLNADLEKRVRVRTLELERTLAQVERQNHEITLRNELGDLLHSCISLEEAGAVIQRFLPLLFPGAAGAVYLATPGVDTLVALAHWGATPVAGTLAPEACWAIRRGKTHLATAADAALVCAHLAAPPAGASLCVPLSAHGESLGLLHLSLPPPTVAP